MIKKYQNYIQNQTTLSVQESWWLLEHVTKKTQAQLLTITDLIDQEMSNLKSAIKELKDQNKPLAYILGFVPFLDLKIQVKTPILIPRHETEEWTAKIIEKFAPFKSKITKICDLGTGSGCIALALAKNFPHAHVTALDINQQALDLAAINAELNNVKNITFLQSDLFSKLSKDSKFDLIVSNPPYIDPLCLPKLPNAVKNWEDHQALFAKNQGLEIITKILQASSKFLQKNSTFPAQLIFEIDHDQHEKVIKIAEAFDWKAEAIQDFFGKYRTIWCTYPAVAKASAFAKASTDMMVG